MKMNTPQKQFDERLRKLMPHVEKVADRHKRFRDFLRDAFLPRVVHLKHAALDKQERLVKVGECIEYWRTNGIDEENWRYVADDFPRWWKMELSKKRSEARKPSEDDTTKVGEALHKVESPKPNKCAPTRKANSS